MGLLQVAHQLLGDTDDSLSVRYGSDLAQGFGIECEALDHVLAVVGPHSVGELPPCVSLPRNVSRIGRPSVYDLARFFSDLSRPMLPVRRAGVKAPPAARRSVYTLRGTCRENQGGQSAASTADCTSL